jgi:hypothetical protein
LSKVSRELAKVSRELPKVPPTGLLSIKAQNDKLIKLSRLPPQFKVSVYQLSLHTTVWTEEDMLMLKKKSQKSQLSKQRSYFYINQMKNNQKQS